MMLLLHLPLPLMMVVVGSSVVWYTAQAMGELGKLDTSTGKTRHMPLGLGSAPHGVIVGPDGSPWVTDGGLNAIVRVDPVTEGVKTFPLPVGTGYANLNTLLLTKTVCCGLPVKAAFTVA